MAVSRASDERCRPLSRLASFLRYISIGGAIGLFAVSSQHLLASTLPSDNLGYVLSISLVYPPSVTVSYWLHKNLSFKKSKTSRNALRVYALLSILYGILSSLFALLIRAALMHVVDIGEEEAATVAFGIAAVLTASVSFFMNTCLVFSGASVSR